MRDILGAEAVREMLDDLPSAIATAGAVGMFIVFVIVWAVLGAGA